MDSPVFEALKPDIHEWKPEETALGDRIVAMLQESTLDFCESRGGHVPDTYIKNNLHGLYTSREAVFERFPPFSRRYVVMDGDTLLGTMLVSKKPDHIFIVDSKRMNIDLRSVPDGSSIGPSGYHWFIHFVTSKKVRGRGIARALLERALTDVTKTGGRGLAGKIEPPLHDFFQTMGFKHRTEYDNFFEAGAELPEGMTVPSEFNDRYKCNCPGLQDLYETRKFKDLVVTIDADDH